MSSSFKLETKKFYKANRNVRNSDHAYALELYFNIYFKRIF